eukprot:Rhum_TRINITY_DN5343_c0_g1::Rhum_TRINITY_DN5343_c0_g1_i1::g.17182::m.17182/K04986/PKD2; polycystin 2
MAASSGDKTPLNYVPLDEGSLLEMESLAVGSPPAKPRLSRVASLENFTQRTRTTSRGHETIELRTLKRFLVKDIDRARSWGQIPFFFVWLLSLTLLVTLSEMCTAGSYNMLYQLEQSHHQELELQKFHEISSIPDFWTWLDLVTKHLWLRDVAPNNVPLGFVLLRQFRVQNVSYVMPKVVAPRFRATLPSSILMDWQEGSVSTAPYGPNKTWVPNRDLPVSIDVLTVDTKFNQYDDTGDAFTITLPFLSTMDEVKLQMKFLQDNGWIDLATRLVIVDILTYNPAVGSFAVNHMYVELFASGSTVAMTKAYPFKILQLGGLQTGVLVLDILVLVCMLYAVVSTVSTIKMNRDIGMQWVGMWEVFEIVLVTFLAVAYSYRFRLWSDGESLMSDDVEGVEVELEMFSRLTEYGYYTERSATFMAIASTMVWLRVLRVIQHNERLGVLSLTVKYASGQLTSLFVIYTFVLVGYSIGATALFGSDFGPMNSLWNSMGYMARLTVSAEVGADWDTLEEIHPSIVWLFLGSFMVLGWLVLLNMVLAIVSGSFAMVQQANGGKLVSWSFSSLYRDIKQAKHDLFGKNFLALYKRGENDKRKAAVLAIRTQARSRLDGYHTLTSCAAWQHLTSKIYTPYESRHIFEKAKCEPDLFADDDDDDDDAADGNASAKDKKEESEDGDEVLLRSSQGELELRQEMFIMKQQVAEILRILTAGAARPVFAGASISAADRHSANFVSASLSASAVERPLDVSQPLAASHMLSPTNARPVTGGAVPPPPSVTTTPHHKRGGSFNSPAAVVASPVRKSRREKPAPCWQCGETLPPGAGCHLCGAGPKTVPAANHFPQSSFNSSGMAPLGLGVGTSSRESSAAELSDGELNDLPAKSSESRPPRMSSRLNNLRAASKRRQPSAHSGFETEQLEV